MHALGDTLGRGGVPPNGRGPTIYAQKAKFPQMSTLASFAIHLKLTKFTPP